jgi:hypothetical protein
MGFIMVRLSFSVFFLSGTLAGMTAEESIRIDAVMLPEWLASEGKEYVQLSGARAVRFNMRVMR